MFLDGARHLELSPCNTCPFANVHIKHAVPQTLKPVQTTNIGRMVVTACSSAGLIQKWKLRGQSVLDFVLHTKTNRGGFRTCMQPASSSAHVATTSQSLHRSSLQLQERWTLTRSLTHSGDTHDQRTRRYIFIRCCVSTAKSQMCSFRMQQQVYTSCRWKQTGQPSPDT